jgi:hypothetical protein
MWSISAISLKALWDSNMKGSKLLGDDLNFLRQNGRASLGAIRDLHSSGKSPARSPDLVLVPKTEQDLNKGTKHAKCIS